MFAVARKPEWRRIVGRPIVGRSAATVAGRIATATALAFRVGADDVAFGVLRFFNRLFALLNLGDEGRLRGGLGCLWGGLGAANLGRVLRSSQVSELQIHRTDRHVPVLPPATFFLL